MFLKEKNFHFVLDGEEILGRDFGTGNGKSMKMKYKLYSLKDDDVGKMLCYVNSISFM